MLAKFAKPAGCAGCALETTGVGYAPPSGIDNSRILYVGEALGYNEAMQGMPFIGAAGGMFSRMLGRAGLTRDQAKVHNCVNCQPPGDWLDGAPWQHSALNQCRQYLQESLNNEYLQVVVTLGSIPLRQVLDLWGVDGIRVQDFHGTVHRDPTDRYWVVPTYHPSHLQRGAINLLDVVRFDLGVAKQILSAGSFVRRPVSLVLDPTVEWFAAWVAQFLAAHAADPHGIPLAVDIETPDKEGGRDEGELSEDDRSTQIDRVNFSCNPDEGVTVPYEGPYIALIDQLLNSGAWLYMWNKRYDESRLRFNNHTFVTAAGEAVTILDLMWAAHHLQSDLPLGLGFWAPFYSDYGAWKHLGKQRGKESEYGGVDGVQTRRVGDGIVGELVTQGFWEVFYRHTHLREQYVLRPAHEAGIPVDVPRLDQFHDKLQIVAADRLRAIGDCEIAGTLKPKTGYKDKPKGPIPKSILGKSGEKGDQAKQDYLEAGVELVQKEIEIAIRACNTCGKRSHIGPKHNCLRKDRPVVEEGSEIPGSDAGAVPDIVDLLVREPRWFWKLPFNPDANAQILKFIRDSGEAPGKAKKTRKDTANKETLRKLGKKTGNPVYQLILDYKAVKKVDSTYAIGFKKRIWSDGRLHPQVTFRPSMFRDSYVAPNPQNVIADKEGKTSLAAGFRHCIVASPGCRIVEIDYSGIEGIDTGWLSGDPDYVRLATLGVHAYLTAHLLVEEGKLQTAPELSWSDQDLAMFFSDVKKKYPTLYDKAKRVVHGNNYGLTTYGMVENFPDVFPGGLKEAQKVQDLYYALAPKLPAYHKRMRTLAYENGYLGGPAIDDYTLLTTSGKHHPFAYRHYFYGVQSFRPLTESDYHKLQWVARKRMKLERHPRVVIINGRPFEIVLGEDSKRVIAFPPQSIAAGTLKEAELALFHPESDTYIGAYGYEGRTPLMAPIHDSLLLNVPDQYCDWIMSVAIGVMRKPIPSMPLPPEWNMGTHLRVNVAVKASPVGGSWEEVETVQIPDMVPETAAESMYLPVEEQDYEDAVDMATRVN